MKRIAYAVFVSALFFMVAPFAHATLIASQEDSSGTPSHYWHSDTVNGAYLALDPSSGQPGYPIGIIATSNVPVVGIHIKAQVDTDGSYASLPRIPVLFDETGSNPYTCAQMPFGGWAYGTPGDALLFTNPLQYSDYNGKMVDMYFQCAQGSGHDLVYGNTPYRLYFYPISTANVFDIYVAMNAAGDKPFFEISDDGTYPPPPPPITIAVPAQGGTYFSTDTIIPQATINNFSSYSSVTYTLNGTVIDPSVPFPALPSGTSTLVIAATNSGGNTVYATSTFMVVSGQPPVVTIATPANGSTYLQNDIIFASATASSSNAIATTTYALNGVLLDPTVPLPLMSQPQGTATLVVSATDAYGARGYATSTFTIAPPDLTAPSVTITNPIAGATYTDASNVFLTATITDASPIVAKSYTFNGANIDPTVPLPLLGAPLGPATVSVSATDAYGNAASSTVTFTIKSSDVTPPKITITNPVAGHSYLSTDTVLAVASITDASGVATSSYVLDDITIDPALPLPLALAGAGPATLVVSATDVFGNSASSSVTFTVTTPPPPDTTGPTVVIVSPSNGKKYSRNDSVLIVANITDQSPIADVRYLFNGKPVDPTKMLQLSKAPLGYATVSVIATDSFGNVGSSTVKFRIMPGGNSCIEDITEAFDHKWFANKNIFKRAFEDCQKIKGREKDRDSYDDDNHRRGKDSQNDDRYQKASKDIEDAFNDIDSLINN